MIKESKKKIKIKIDILVASWMDQDKLELKRKPWWLMISIFNIPFIF